MGHSHDSQKRHLLLGTVSFTVCFAAWGLISAFAPHFRQQFHLSATQTAFLVAVPGGGRSFEVGMALTLGMCRKECAVSRRKKS